MTRHFALLLGITSFCIACEKERQPPPVYQAAEPEPALQWKAPPTIEQIVTPSVPEAELVFEKTPRSPQCWEFLESAGKVVDPFPSFDETERLSRLASCGVEARMKLADGAQFVAWGTAEDPTTRARDLRIAVWESDGKLRWSQNMDRSRQAPNWVANFRRSFVTELPDHLCAGTLWEGDTQVLCASRTSGEVIWKGSLPFWAGIDPQPAKDGLIVADLSAISKRYPFNGSEMRQRKLDALGGRAGYYATDAKRLYFAPSRQDTPPLIAYDLDTFEEVWRVALPSSPKAQLAHAFGKFKRLLVQLDDTLFALDTEAGAVVWAYDIGDDVPSVASDKTTLYVLSRRANTPNRLVAIDPASGERQWVAQPPTGTIRVQTVDDVLMVGSIRAMQRVRKPQENRDGE